MGNGPKMSRPDKLRIFPDCAGIVVGLARLPDGTSSGQLAIRQHDVDRALFSVDHDRIAVLQQPDRAANRRLRTNMADAEAACGTGEAPVGYQRHLLAHTLAVDR